MRCNPISYNTNLYFGNEKARRLAENTADIMKLYGVRAQIMEDGDKNEYDGSPFRNEDAYPIIDKLEKEFAKEDVESNIDVANWCSNFVVHFSDHPLSRDESLPKDIRDAVIIRYLNQLALPINMAYKTSELDKYNQ